MLPSYILPCETMDTPDMRYLSFEYAPKQKPFGKTFDIEAYNMSWYDDAPPIRHPQFYKDTATEDIGNNNDTRRRLDTKSETRGREQIQNDDSQGRHNNDITSTTENRIIKEITSSLCYQPRKID